MAVCGWQEGGVGQGQGVGGWYRAWCGSLGGTVAQRGRVMWAVGSPGEAAQDAIERDRNWNRGEGTERFSGPGLEG